MIQSDEHNFQMGWFNHQLAFVFGDFFLNCKHGEKKLQYHLHIVHSQFRFCGEVMVKYPPSILQN